MFVYIYPYKISINLISLHYMWSVRLKIKSKNHGNIIVSITFLIMCHMRLKKKVRIMHTWSLSLQFFLHPNSFQLIFIYQVIMQFKYLVLFAALISVKLRPHSYAVTFGIYILFYCTHFMLVDRQTHLA